MTPDQDPPGFIVCPVTGRRWPAIKGFELKDCIKCGGKIDIRVEAWADGPKHGRCPPPRVMQGEVIKADAPAVALKKAMTGKEVIAEMDKFRDTVHEAWLNDPARRAVTEMED